MARHFLLRLGAISLILWSGACKRKTPADTSPLPSEEPVGYSLLRYLPGIYQGQLTSTTSVGNFPFWGVDFRPLHPAQVGGRSELDSANNLHLNFFVAEYQNRRVLCFRNGGYFQGMERITYLIADSVVEGRYYRFVEPITRGQRAYAEVVFPAPDSLILTSYTTKMGTRPQPVLHIRWAARKTYDSAYQQAAAHHNYPQPVVVATLDAALQGRTEAIWYSPITNDPYPEAVQPYGGFLRASYQHGSGYTPDPQKNVLLFLTVQPLVEGYTYYPERLGTLSRYVVLKASESHFFFKHVHPGRYFLYALYDQDGNGAASSGDWFSLPAAEIEVPPQDTVSAQVVITFRLP